ncbi:MAG: hypothetical protein HY426_04220 [Candidatus Levybacteria bacterium]|nr:hypothetical protein [Candidatus Levybacteria bacterium]
MADSYERRERFPTNAGPSVPVDMAKYVPMIYTPRGKVPFDMTERIMPKPKVAKLIAQDGSSIIDGVEPEAYTASWGLQSEREEILSDGDGSIGRLGKLSRDPNYFIQRPVSFGTVVEDGDGSIEIVDVREKGELTPRPDRHSLRAEWYRKPERKKVQGSGIHKNGHVEMDQDQPTNGQDLQLDASDAPLDWEELSQGGEIPDSVVDNLSPELQADYAWFSRDRESWSDEPGTWGIGNLGTVRTTAQLAISQRDLRAVGATGEFGRPKDQDPDRGVHRELVGVTTKWGRSEKVLRPWVGNREKISEREHIHQELAGAQADPEVEIPTLDEVFKAEGHGEVSNAYDIVDFEVVLPELEPVAEEDRLYPSLANGSNEVEDDLPLRDRQVLARTRLFLDPNRSESETAVLSKERKQEVVDQAEGNPSVVVIRTSRPDKHTKRSVELGQEEDNRHLRLAIASKARAFIKQVRASGEKIRVKKPVRKPQLKAWQHVLLDRGQSLRPMRKAGANGESLGREAGRPEVARFLASQERSRLQQLATGHPSVPVTAILTNREFRNGRKDTHFGH